MKKVEHRRFTKKVEHGMKGKAITVDVDVDVGVVSSVVGIDQLTGCLFVGFP
jgi:hypothetical protein